MTKFKVGDKVRVIDVSAIKYGSKYFYDGMITEVTNMDDDGYIYLRTKFGRGRQMFIYKSEFHAVEIVKEGVIKLAEDRRLTDALTRISELESKVKALENVIADKDKPTLDKLLAERKTPNHRRADVIKRARTYIEELRTKRGNYRVEYEQFVLKEKEFWHPGQYATCGVEFVIDAEKRTVVALLRGELSKDLYARGIAKCAPGDVFNAVIGKAIALGRALGVNIPDEFTDAPQPTEKTVGMKVIHPRHGVLRLVRQGGYVAGGNLAIFNSNAAEIATIIDDTDADYEVSS